MGVEYELKFRATPAVQEAIRAQIEGPEQEFHMETTYYDALDGGLSQRFYTLRRRLENGKSVCTLKTPNDGNGRGEWECPCDHIEAAIEELCKLGGPEELSSLTQAGLVPVCGAKFTRIAKTVQLPDAVVELALDQGVLTGGDKALPFYEVEAELKSGSEAALMVFAQALAQRFSLKPELKSKFRRSLDLSKGE